MNTKEAISLFRHYQQSNHRKRTAESYRYLLQHFESLYADRHLDSIKPDEIYHFLESRWQEVLPNPPEGCAMPN